MRYILFAIELLELLAFIYLALATIYVVVFGLASLFPIPKKKKISDKQRKFAVLIPGYKEDNVIVGAAGDAVHQNYPKELFEVIVIADSFRPETLAKLRELPVRVVEVVFEISKKSKALNKCMSIIGDDYDIAMILDADNIMDSNVLARINDAFNRGFLAVQGHRMAKNHNTSIAVLDAISEEINNNLFRKGHRVIGLSSALIGSGMGIDYALFKKTMATVDSVGEDKEVEIKLLKEGYKIEYLEDAWIYDEKTSKKDIFINQRRRWLAAQIEFFKKYFFNGLWNLLRHGNIDYFDKVIQMLLPPRILLVGLLFIFSITRLIITYLQPKLYLPFVPASFWLLTFALTLFALLIALPLKFYNLKTLRALFSLPTGFVLMAKSLLRIKGASKRFIHTPHGHHGDECPKSK